MSKMIFAAFADRDDADQAIDDLGKLGIKGSEISTITKGGFKKEASEAEEVAAGAGSGAVKGGVIGGLAGLLAASLGIVILGPIAALLGAAGIIGTTISGIGIGMAAGALVGALTKIGLSKEQATRYEEIVNKNGVVIGVRTNGNEQGIRTILTDNNAEDITELDIENNG